MSRIFYFILLAGIIFHLSACQSETVYTASALPQAPVKVRVKPTYEAADRSYEAHWGDLDFPVVNDPLPGNKVKQFTISKDSFLANFYKPLSFTKGGKPMSLDVIAIVVYNRVNGQPSMYHFYERSNFSVDTTRIGNTLQQYVEMGAHISIRGFRENIPINSVAFRIHDPEGEYHPPAYFKSINFIEKEVFSFQLYTAMGRKTLVRLDTTAEEAQNVYKIYRDKPDSYEVLHIPGFKTVRRSLKDEEKLWPSDDFIRVNLLDKTKLWPKDLQYYPEYYEFEDKVIQLNWDNLKTPSIREKKEENWNWRYGPKWEGWPKKEELFEFLSAARSHPLKLIIDKELWTPVRFDCWITSEDGEDYRFLTEDIRHPEINKVLENLPRRSSIYIDNLLVENKDGEVKWFPVPFAFHFP